MYIYIYSFYAGLPFGETAVPEDALRRARGPGGLHNDSKKEDENYYAI